MNYGVDDKYLAFTEEDLEDFDYLGIRCERDADKTYLISSNNKLIGIIDNSASYEELENMIYSNLYTDKIIEYNSDSRSSLGSYVREIEKQTGKTVDNISFDNNSYTITVEGETVTIPYGENKSLDMNEVLSKVGKRTTFQASDKLNDENKVVIENYLKESLATDANVEVRLNEEGNYSIFIDGQEYIKLEKDVTLADTVKSISDQFDKDRSVDDYNKNYASYKLQARTNQNYKVYIDEDLFNEVSAKHNKVKNDIEDVKTLYRTDMMTDDLLDAYNETVGAEGNTNPTERISKTTELLENISMNVKYSLEAYKNIDHNLGIIFNSVVNDIFKINSYHKEGELKSYKNQTFEERQATLDNILKQYQEALDELKGELNKLYPSYYDMDRCTDSLPEETYVILDTLMSCFVDNSGGFDANNSFRISQFQKFVSFSKEYDLMTKLDAYFGGDSWRQSGMSDLNDILLKKLLTHESQDATESMHGVDFLYQQTEDTLYAGTSLIKKLEAEGVITSSRDSNGVLWYEYPDDTDGDYIYGRDSKKYGYKDGSYYFTNDSQLLTYLLDKNIDSKCEQAFLLQFYDSAQINLTNNSLNNINRNLRSEGLLDLELFDLLAEGVNEIEENDCVYLKNCMGDIYNKKFSYKDRSKEEPQIYNLEEYCSTRIDECNSYIQDVSLLSESVYQYTQLKNLLPYEIEMESLDYLDYLVKDYSKYELDESITSDNIAYLSQEELALYDYLKNTDKDRAAGYIKALQDTINQRKGYEEAALRIYEASKNGEDAIDILTMSNYGLSDGVENFINGLGDFFVGLDKTLNLGIINDENFGEIRTSTDYRNMYMLSLLQQDNVYNEQLSEAFREVMSFEYKANSSIGNMAIPTLVSFIPVVGKVLSPVLLGMSAAGNTMRQTMLEGHSGSEALIYGLASGASEVLLEKLLGGITGLNGSTEALQGFQAFLHSMVDEAKEEFIQAYFDGIMRSIILKEPFDLSSVNSEAVESALMALYTSGVMNCATNCAIKIADEIVYWSPSQFNSYAEFNNYITNKVADRQSLIDISPETAAKMGINLKDGETLKYNPNTNTYQKVNKQGYRFNIPNNVINEYEGVMDIILTPEEQASLAAKHNYNGTEDNANVSVRYSKATDQSVADVENVIDILMNKYNISRDEAIKTLKDAVRDRRFDYITRDGDARKTMMQYGFDGLDDTLRVINSMDYVSQQSVNDVEYAIKQIMDKYGGTREDAIKIFEDLIADGDYNRITRQGNARNIVSQYSVEELDSIIAKIKVDAYNSSNNYLDPNGLFSDLAKKFNGSYGVDQGAIYELFTFVGDDGKSYTYRQAVALKNEAIEQGKPVPHFTKYGSEQYFKVKDYMTSTYGLTSNEASILLSTIDDAGACSYASVANEIFTSYEGKEAIFEQNFGFSMYDKDTGRPNYELLLADMYLNINRTDNGGSFVKVDPVTGEMSLNQGALNNRVDPLGRRMLDADSQRYLSNSRGKNEAAINNYLYSRGAIYSTEIVSGVDDHSSVNYQNMERIINGGFDHGYNYSLGIYSKGDEIRLISTDGKRSSVSTKNWSEGGGHSVYVTGISEKGLVVSSWGGKYVIPFSDLSQSGAYWVLTRNKVNIN